MAKVVTGPTDWCLHTNNMVLTAFRVKLENMIFSLNVQKHTFNMMLMDE